MDMLEFIFFLIFFVVQDCLGVKNVGIFDINIVCVGFVMAMDIGFKYICFDEQYNYVFVIGVYVMSKYLNKVDKKMVMFFVDGVGVVVLKVGEDILKGVLAIELIIEGQYNEWMGIYGGVAKQLVMYEMIEQYGY